MDRQGSIILASLFDRAIFAQDAKVRPVRSARRMSRNPTCTSRPAGRLVDRACVRLTLRVRTIALNETNHP